MYRGDRQFSRGGVATSQRPDQANRHRRRFHRYVRRRNHSGGGAGSYGRGGSFSDDRNDSSSPPIQMNRQQVNNNDEHQQQHQHPPSSSPYVQQQPTYPQQQQQQQQSSKVQHRSQRGSRKSHYDSRHSRANDQQKQERPFYDNTNMYLSSRNQQSSRNNAAYADGSDNDYNENIHSGDQHQSHGYANNKKLDDLTKSFQAQKADVDEIKLTLSKLTLELDQVKSRIKELESTKNGPTNSSKIVDNNQQSVSGDVIDNKSSKVVRKKIRVRREKRSVKLAEKRTANTISKSSASQQQILTSDSKQTSAAAAATGESEKQQVEPSTQRTANNHQNRNQDRRRRKFQPRNKRFPELSESELNEIVQNLKREFVNLERPMKSIKNTMNDKGPRVVYEFAVSILDHAICDVTSPTKLSEISNNLYQLIVSRDNTSEVDFQQGFYDALTDISKREDDIAIDAPRYLDTLGQVLADCIVPMSGKYSNLMKKFLNRSLSAYNQKNRGALLANIMKGIAGVKSERFAKQVFDVAQLNWQNILLPETDLNEFIECHTVTFTTRTFSPERELEKAPKELEKFADDVTKLVESKCTAQNLDDFVKDLNFPKEDQVDYLGTLIYAIIRGCIHVDTDGNYQVDRQALKEYSSILSKKHDEQDATALNALTALTKLWHQYNCPQGLFLLMLTALHSFGIASNEALDEWLNSENLTNIPGIGAARLCSKRWIEQLGGT